VVTDDAVLASADFATRAAAVMDALGERGALHLRARQTTARHLYALATALAPIATNTGAWLVINDRVDVALAANIRRVQLTSHSLTPAEVQAVPGPWELGLSIHATSEAAPIDAVVVRWLLAGHVYATPSHQGPGGGPGFIAEVAKATDTPVIAIGGITPDRVRALRRVGAAGIAAIRGVWSARDAAAASIAYLTAYDAGGNE
jgi:thiazole tautomerase (transcriptional regulator TenI)